MMSASFNSPYGFGFAPDPFSTPIGEDASEPDAFEQERPEAHKEPRFSYGALHSAIKRDREWFR